MTESQTPSPPITDRWIKCITTSGTVRGVSLNVTDLCRELADLHQLTGPNAVALGEALIAGFLYASFCKVGERANLNIQGDGWIKQALVDAYPEGYVRGYVIPNSAWTGESESGEGPWGAGFLSMLRTKSLERAQPYIGTVPLVTGFLAKDLTFYWHQSEQVPSAVGIAVNLGLDGKIMAAGGFLVQTLPGAQPEEIRDIDVRVSEMTSLAHQIAASDDPMSLLTQIFQDNAFMVLETRPLTWQCQCSWERVERALLLIGADELRSIQSTEGRASITCEFCTKEYVADQKMLGELIERASG